MGLRLVPSSRKRPMFTRLIESRRTRERRLGGTTVSVLVHAAVITLGVYVTARATEAPVVETPETPIYIAAPPEAPRNTSHHRSRGDVHERQSWNERESPIPPIDLTREITNDRVFRTTGSTLGTNSVDDGARSDVDHPYFESQVEKPALA